MSALVDALAERYVLLKAQSLFFLENPLGCDWIDVFQVLGVGLAVVWSARTSYFVAQTHRLQSLLMPSAASGADRELGVALQRVRPGIRALAGRRAAAALDRQRPIQVHGASDELLLCNVGFLRPRVLVSRGVLNLLDADELAAALAHELAHVVRRDNLKRALAEVVCFTAPVVVWWSDALRLSVSPPRFFLLDLALGLAAGLALRMLLVPALVHWQERRCDEWAAAAVGDRLAVASALVKMARSRHAVRIVPHPATAFAFYGEPVTRRIRSLVRRGGGRLVLGLDRALRLPLRGLMAAMVIVGALTVHHAEVAGLAASVELRTCVPTLVLHR